ncbi:hypothetical protein IF2G_00546 [Cordyceps javanica]|nr:hypothetical protein IF2G_00546 [Cordyceps javanica]
MEPARSNDLVLSFLISAFRGALFVLCEVHVCLWTLDWGAKYLPPTSKDLGMLLRWPATSTDTIMHS